MGLYKYVVYMRRMCFLSIILFFIIFLSLTLSSLCTVIFVSYPDALSFWGTLLGSILGVLGSYLIFNIENRKRDKDNLECLLVLLKFTVTKVDKVLSYSVNIENNVCIELTNFAYEIVYDKEWYKYLRLIDSYEDKESIIKFLDYIQRNQKMSLGDLIDYRYNIIDILKKYKKYDSTLDKDDLYDKLKENYNRQSKVAYINN